MLRLKSCTVRVDTSRFEFDVGTTPFDVVFFTYYTVGNYSILDASEIAYWPSL